MAFSRSGPPRFPRPFLKALSCALPLFCAGCGTEADEGPKAPESTASTGVFTPRGDSNDALVPRAERLARVGAALREHAHQLERQGIGKRLGPACQELLDAEIPGSHFIKTSFGISKRSMEFLATWNCAESRTGESRARSEKVKRRALEGLADIARQLRERGIQLLVVPIPVTAQIYPERILDEVEPPADFVGADPGLTEFLGALVEQDVEVVHLTPLLAANRVGTAEDQDRYLFHDYNSHWTPRGAKLTATAVAERVVQMEGVDPGTFREGTDWHQEHQKIMYRVSPPQGIEIPGLEVETEVWIDAILNAQGERFVKKDAKSPILLLGDSNAQWYGRNAASLLDQLVAGVNQYVDVVALAGAPADGVWKALARREPAGGLAEKKVVVWVFELNMLFDEELGAVTVFTD